MTCRLRIHHPFIWFDELTTGFENLRTNGVAIE